MKNPKNKRTSLLVIVLLGLLLVAYKVVFVSVPVDTGVEDENTMASQRVESILAQVESINFDNVSIARDPKFQSLQSIDTPLESRSYGKKNPFSAIFGQN